MENNLFTIIAPNLLSDNSTNFSKKFLDKVEPKNIYDSVEKYLIKSMKRYYLETNVVPNFQELNAAIIRKPPTAHDSEGPDNLDNFNKDVAATLKTIKRLIKSDELDLHDGESLEGYAESYIKASYLQTANARIEFTLDQGSVKVDKSVDLIDAATSFTLQEFKSYDPFEANEDGSFSADLEVDDVKIPFGIGILDKIYAGGMPRKTLTCVMATTGGGKSIIMNHTAVNAVLQGFNVLYISMELSKTMIHARSNANMFDLPISDMLDPRIATAQFTREKSAKVRNRYPSLGKFRIEKLPAGEATCRDFERILNEYALHENLRFDLVVIDYVGITASYKVESQVGLYSVGKAVAEEMRNLAEQYDVAIFTATQANRSAYDAKKGTVTLSNVSESMGLAHTVDIFFNLESGGEFGKNNYALVSQLKNRFGDISGKYDHVVCGLNKSNMKFYDLTRSQTKDAYLFIGREYDETKGGIYTSQPTTSNDGNNFLFDDE